MSDATAFSDRLIELELPLQGESSTADAVTVVGPIASAIDRLRHRLTADPDRRVRSQEADYVEAATNLADLDHLRRKEALTEVIRQFEKFAVSHAEDDGALADPISAQAARAFVTMLPSAYQLPRIAPDIEGDIGMIWESGDHTVLLTVEGWRLHAVIDPTSPNSQSIDDLPFDGEVIPTRIRRHLPIR